MSTTAITNKSIGLHSDDDETVQKMDLDHEIPSTDSLQHKDQEMQEPPQAVIHQEESRSMEPTRKKIPTPDRDPKDVITNPTSNTQCQQQQQEESTAISRHSNSHESVDDTHRQNIHSDTSYQHVQNYSKDNSKGQSAQLNQENDPVQQQQRQQSSYHHGNNQKPASSHQEDQPSLLTLQPSQEHPIQAQDQTSQDPLVKEEINKDNKPERVLSVSFAAEISPTAKESTSNIQPTFATNTPAVAVNSKELQEARSSIGSGINSSATCHPIESSSEPRLRGVGNQDTAVLSSEPHPNNKRPSTSDDSNPERLSVPRVEDGASSSVPLGGSCMNSEDEASGSQPRSSKIPRKVREPVRKVPKVYPPRKPRVRPVAVEHLTMTIRTDSALSTLASAAVAIKDHQGPLSTLSVPPLSPTIHASTTMSPSNHIHHDGSPSTLTNEPKVTSVPTTAGTNGGDGDAVAGGAAAAGAMATVAVNAGGTAVGGSGQTAGRGSRASNKANIPQDSGGYRCELCPGERFGRVHDLKRHQISKHNEMTWPCDFCHRPFVRRDALLRHYAVKASRRDGVHPTAQEESRLQEAKARAKLLS
ncbi:hypothetical protein FBU30_001892 [Linnemannia zychae]|nr:hypothetical protein FBU30_001892 [Linnemannia zychae]